jgi:hypothetical protein
MSIVRLFGLCGLLAAATALSAQEPKDQPAAAGAQPGKPVPSPFRAYMVADDRFPPKANPPVTADDRDPRDRTAKLHCLVCENGLSPVVAVFVRTDAAKLKDSGVAKLAAAVNGLILKEEYRADRVAGFVQFLKIEGMPKAITLTDPDGSQMMVELDAEYPDDEQRDVYAADIRDLATATKAPNVVFGLAPVKSRATDAWEIGAADEVTVVIYNRLRVEGRWKFGATGPTDAQVAEIVAATEAMITGKVAKK